MYDNGVSKEELIKFKTNEIIKNIMKHKNMSAADAARLWYNSKTKKATLDSTEYYLSVARICDELEMELNHDPFWMLNPFD